MSLELHILDLTRGQKTYFKMLKQDTIVMDLSFQDGKKELKNRWDLIRTALLDNITSSYDVEVSLFTDLHHKRTFLT
jgi:hypothetical protein